MAMDYKKSVAVFGLAIPMFVLLALIVAVFVAKSHVSSTYQRRVQSHQQAKNLVRRIIQSEKEVESQKALLQTWNTMITSETRRSFLQHWKDAGKFYKPKEFQMDLPSWSNESSGLGKGGSQSAVQVTMNFDGSYRAMQTALMKVETRLPQMQLDEMEMRPNKDGRTMNFKTTHTIWTKD